MGEGWCHRDLGWEVGADLQIMYMNAHLETTQALTETTKAEFSSMADQLRRAQCDSCEIELSDVGRFLIRKAFCASQKALSDFIRDFSRRQAHRTWFQDLLSTISDQHSMRTEMTMEGDGCTWDMYVRSATDLLDVAAMNCETSVATCSTVMIKMSPPLNRYTIIRFFLCVDKDTREHKFGFIPSLGEQGPECIRLCQLVRFLDFLQ
jgi:hypothetical protein